VFLFVILIKKLEVNICKEMKRHRIIMYKNIYNTGKYRDKFYFNALRDIFQ